MVPDCVNRRVYIDPKANLTVGVCLCSYLYNIKNVFSYQASAEVSEGGYRKWMVFFFFLAVSQVSEVNFKSVT